MATPNRIDISVVMATCNGARFVREQLDSLARQSLLPCELIVSDDNSQDTTLDIVRDFLPSAPFPMRVLSNQERKGFADNFLSAAGEATGEVIAYCDQDDYWLPEKLERCAQEFGNSQVQLVAHSLQEVDETLAHTFGISPAGALSEVIAPGGQHPILTSGVAGCAMLLRRPLLLELIERWPAQHLEYVRRTGNRSVIGHDFASLHLAHAMASVSFIAEPLVKHRHHGLNTWSGDVCSTRLKRLVQVLRTDAKNYRGRAEQSCAAAKMLRLLACGDDAASLHFASLAEVEHTVGQSLSLRAELYESSSPLLRLRYWIRLAATGAYKDRSAGGLGVRSAAKDLAAALL